MFSWRIVFDKDTFLIVELGPSLGVANNKYYFWAYTELVMQILRSCFRFYYAISM